MSATDRRLVTVLVVLSLVAVPAVIFRLLCVGESCTEEAASTRAPFCSLPADLRNLVTAGFHEGRSPDALGVTGRTLIVTDNGGDAVPWPAVRTDMTDLRVPLVLMGPGISRGALPPVVRLDAVAPTLARLLGLHRRHAEVRSGRAIPGVVRGAAARTPLIVEIVWKGKGSSDVAGARFLARIESFRGGGAAGSASVGSLPMDPAAVLTTIGSGGLPAQHGITGTLLRAGGGVARAWTAKAPTSVIATLGDDLDWSTGGNARIGLVGTNISDRGLIGGTWYLGDDDDTVRIRDRADPHGAVADVGRLLRSGWGRDRVPDLLGVVLDGPVGQMDAATARIVRLVRAGTPGATIVVTATGALDSGARQMSGVDLARQVDRAVDPGNPVVAAIGAGGLFIDPAAAARAGAPAQRVVDAMLAATAPATESPLFADAFPAFAVAFGRYC